MTIGTPMRQMLHRCATGVVAGFAATLAYASPLGPDGVPGQSHPGKFIWFDLATEDPAGSRAFYGAVFGWRFRTVESALPSYTLIEDAVGKVGGMFRHSRPPGATVGSRWVAMISVPDPAKAAQYVQKNGGQVVAAPVTLSGRGTYAVLRDPQGAVFGVLAASDGDPPDAPVEDGDVFWLDLFTPQPAQAADFYAGLAGYEVSHGETGWERKRWVLATEGFARAGIVALPPGKSSPGWLPYILVDDVTATLTRAGRAGGKVVVEPRPDLLDGNVAVIADPSGGVVGVVNWVIREDVRPPSR